jgi:hypothetical protein
MFCPYSLPVARRNVFALFGVVAALLIATVALTLSRPRLCPAASATLQKQSKNRAIDSHSLLERAYEPRD